MRMVAGNLTEGTSFLATREKYRRLQELTTMWACWRKMQSF